jgi:type IV secretion system protein VirD4
MEHLGVDWRTKLCFGLALLIASLVAGLYLGGSLTLKRLGQDSDVAWRTSWPYWQATSLPQFAPYVWKITLVAAVGFFVPLAVWIAAVIPLLRTKQRSLHGESRFAQKSDLTKAGLLKDSPDGIVVGKFGKELILFSGQQVVILDAPTRSDKGVVIPNLLAGFCRRSTFLPCPSRRAQ